MTAVSFQRRLTASLCMLMAAVCTIGVSRTPSAFGDEPEICISQTLAPPADSRSSTSQLRLLGVQRAQCGRCHTSEVRHWLQTSHARSPYLRLFPLTGPTREYARALKIRREDLLTTSVCAECHASVAERGSTREFVSGVSCESCHGAAGGNSGWLNAHHSYHAQRSVPRNDESPEHRLQRIRRIEQAGMIRADNVYGMARRCFECHLVPHQQLIAAGHPHTADWSFSAATEGAIRHNFFLNPRQNAAVPTLWQQTTGRTALERRRIKYVAGLLARLEMSLRARAHATDPDIAPEISGDAHSAIDALQQAARLLQIDEVTQTLETVIRLRTRLDVIRPDDSAVYIAAADQIESLGYQFVRTSDGAALSAIDAVLPANRSSIDENRAASKDGLRQPE